VAGRKFSPDSSTNKTDCHDITEILLKVVLNTITLHPIFCFLAENTASEKYNSIHQIKSVRQRFSYVEFTNRSKFYTPNKIGTTKILICRVYQQKKRAPLN
jgi:hypothetical protein